jgi:hypothetical protein
MQHAASWRFLLHSSRTSSTLSKELFSRIPSMDQRHELRGKSFPSQNTIPSRVPSYGAADQVHARSEKGDWRFAVKQSCGTAQTSLHPNPVRSGRIATGQSVWTLCLAGLNGAEGSQIKFRPFFASGDRARASQGSRAARLGDPAWRT